jgi:potassium-transporting ATPase KdpC subunit
MLAPLRISIVLLILCGGLYPAAVALVGGTAFPYQAGGSLITDRSGHVIGSELIAQPFDKDVYFHPRPSAAGTQGYDPTASGGSNLAPTNRVLIDRIKADAAALRQEDPTLTVLPADLLTTSASGLDPDISVAAAMAQVPRVAKARNVGEDKIVALVNAHTTGRDLGIFGDPRVNVLKLNLALDELAPLH